MSLIDKGSFWIDQATKAYDLAKECEDVVNRFQTKKGTALQRSHRAATTALYGVAQIADSVTDFDVVAVNPITKVCLRAASFATKTLCKVSRKSCSDSVSLNEGAWFAGTTAWSAGSLVDAAIKCQPSSHKHLETIPGKLKVLGTGVVCAAGLAKIVQTVACSNETSSQVLVEGEQGILGTSNTERILESEATETQPSTSHLIDRIPTFLRGEGPFSNTICPITNYPIRSPLTVRDGSGKLVHYEHLAIVDWFRNEERKRDGKTPPGWPQGVPVRRSELFFDVKCQLDIDRGLNEALVELGPDAAEILRELNNESE